MAFCASLYPKSMAAASEGEPRAAPDDRAARLGGAELGVALADLDQRAEPQIEPVAEVVVELGVDHGGEALGGVHGVALLDPPPLRAIVERLADTHEVPDGEGAEQQLLLEELQVDAEDEVVADAGPLELVHAVG